ncbi:hypothetical protein [Streptosporangium sandarakinum]|uniref:hypothetical protein n=1 Tax=Streptosporangium sandarakinum TaxID=1260955 RepID=UPI0033BB1AA6
MGAAEVLRHHGIRLELLTGPLQGEDDPPGYGAAPLAFFTEITGHAHGGAIEAGDQINPLVLDFFARL